VFDRPNATRRAASFAVALAATGLIASGCGGGSANAESITSLVSAGEEGDQVTLPVPFAVGQAATTEGTYGVSLAIDGLGLSESVGFTFDLRLIETVESVDEDGGAVVHSTVDDLSVLDAPPTSTRPRSRMSSASRWSTTATLRARVNPASCSTMTS
jgi:hypothetical protein